MPTVEPHSHPMPSHGHDATYVNVSGDTMTGPLTVAATIEVGDSGGKVTLEPSGGRRMVTGRLANGTVRWTLRLGDVTNSPETGNNAGSDFFLYGYNDAGTLLNTPIRIYRNTGLMVLAGDPTTALGAATKGYVDGAVLYGLSTVTTDASGMATVTACPSTHWLASAQQGNAVAGSGMWVGRINGYTNQVQIFDYTGGTANPKVNAQVAIAWIGVKK